MVPQKEGDAEQTTEDSPHGDAHSTPPAGRGVPMLEFSNNFECANLSCVMRVRDTEYDITLWRDYNTCVRSAVVRMWRDDGQCTQSELR